jgi:hypothetical protein
MGIFDYAYGDKLFATYDTTIRYQDRIAGGTPADPRMIDAWLRTKAGLTNDEERRQVVLRTLKEMKPELFMPGENGVPAIDIETATYDDLVAASTKAAQDKQTNGFKRPDGKHLAIETRHPKAMLKEVTSILYSAERWGPTRKGPKSFTAERVFIDAMTPSQADVDQYVKLAMRAGTPADEIAAKANAMLSLSDASGKPLYPEFLFLHRPDGSLIDAPDDVETFIGHVITKTGPQSNLTLVQVVKQATVRFKVRVINDAISHDYWPFIWLTAQQNGLGAMRSQSYGRFDVLQFEHVGGNFSAPKWEMDPTKAPTQDEIVEIARARQEAIEAGVIAAEPTRELIKV